VRNGDLYRAIEILDELALADEPGPALVTIERQYAASGDREAAGRRGTVVGEDRSSST
jgi:hypothetical protein